MWNWFKRKFLRNKWREMSMGELFDKHCILTVKDNRIKDKDKRAMALSQLLRLNKYIWREAIYCLKKEQRSKLYGYVKELGKGHAIQWDAEDKVLSATDVHEAMEAAKLSRHLNKRRAVLKRKIDLLFNEQFLEVKDYASTNELKSG